MNEKVEENQLTIKVKHGQKMTIQVCLIGLVAILGIGFGAVVLEHILVREALRSEADHFWKMIESDADFLAPNTANLKGFYVVDGQNNSGVEGLLSDPNKPGSHPNAVSGQLKELKASELPKEKSPVKGLAGISKLPAEYLAKRTGFHKISGEPTHSLLYVSEKSQSRIYLLFDGKRVLRLALFFGLFPLGLVLVLIYITAWWVYRESSSLLSPIVWLANKFDKFDPAHPDASLEDLNQIPGDSDWEIEKLVNSFSTYSRRIKRFVERERSFTRDTSHELRTPLTVIKMASDLLLAEQELDDYSKKYVTRIKGSAQDMEELIDAFLILARETDKEFIDEQTAVLDVINNEIRVAQIYLEDKPIAVEIDEQFPLELFTARKVMSIVLGNLIRNAALYTNEGKIKIIIQEFSVVIQDTGIGMSEDQISRVFHPYYRAQHDAKTKRRGYGVGLTIVKRLCNRFGWTVNVQSEVDVGTSIEVVFIEKR